jgi:tape measure domain-containing protein
VADRVVSVLLKLEVDQARRNATSAATAFRGLADSVENAGRSQVSLSRLGNIAKSTGKAVATAGGFALGGMAALTVATTKGGIAYNTLEQTSRAALTTVLGSAGAATNQMERLREFAKTSPFPRQVWISAQQQLLAFGMSAEKIIPTFQAVQDAVAAAGGGGQQITEVVDVLAKVQSTGKVTTETLNELGSRGIDAATLVGQAMGKTAAEVRNDIQAQAISGVQFIDVLTTAMETRFGGAAANVKQTWAGAKDRIKGAVRDIGSLLAEPLVDPEGGGAAVEWANAVADALRALEARLKPIMAAIGDRAAPLFDALTEKLKALAEWIRTADFSKIGQQIASMAPAVAAITAGFSAMGAKSLPIIGNLVGGLKPLPVALAAAALASPELRSALLDLLAAAQPLIAAVGQAAQIFAGALGPVLAVVAALLQPVIVVIRFLGDVLNSLPGPIQAVVGGLLLFKGLQMAGALQGITTAFVNFRSEMGAQQKFAAMAGQEVGGLGAAYSVAASKVSGAAVGIRGAMASAAGFLAGPWGAAIGLGVSALALFSTSQQNASASTADFNVELDKQTGQLTGSSVEAIYKWASAADTLTTNGAHVKDVLADFGLTANDLTGYLTGNAEATERVNRALASHDSVAERNSFKAFLDESKGKLDRQRDAAEGAAEANSKYGGDTQDAADAANNAASANVGLTGAMGVAAQATADASAQLQQMRSDLQALYDAQFGLEEAQDKFQGGFNRLRSMFESNSRGAAKAAGATDKHSDALKRQAKIVADTRKQLEDLAEAQRKAEKEAREAAEAAKQRRLDELFGKQFDVQSTRDSFSSSLAQAAKDIKDAKKEKVAGATSLSGLSEGALGNRDRMRSLVQQAQAVIQAEIDRGASKQRISAVTKDLQTQLSSQAKSWGLNAKEVQAYTQAIGQFGGLANTVVKPNLAAVRKEYAEQRKEIKANAAEQIQSAKESARSAVASSGAAAATKVHTAALKGNTESAIENRAWFRQQVQAAQDELAQMKLNGAGKEAVTKRGKELAAQLAKEGRAMGFAEADMETYTGAIKDSAVVINHYPTLNVKAKTAGALTTIANFVRGVNNQMSKIQKNFSLGIRTGSEYVNTRGGGHMFPGMASGGFVSGPGGPRDDKVPAWLSNGEYVINAASTRQNRALLEAINSGRVSGHDGAALPAYARGGPVGHVDPIRMNYKASFRKGTARDIWSAFRNELMVGLVGQAGAGSIGGSGVQRWAPLVLEVLKMLRQPSWLLPHVLRRMNQESGGNPRAINLWDSNARRGTPSIGLMQTIGPTFAAHAGPFARRGIYDPLANIYAGLHYALTRYGSIQYAMDKPGGYRSGGLVEKVPAKPVVGDFMRGSYRRGTPYVPMDGMYQLHRGERVVPADSNRGAVVAIEFRGDGSRASEFVLGEVQKANATGRLKLTVR